MAQMFRQGDLLFIKVEQLPLDVEPTSPVLAVGESTGHKHRATSQLQVFRRPSGEIFLQGSGQIVHEQHDALTLPEGIWTMRRQREYEAGTRRGRLIQD